MKQSGGGSGGGGASLRGPSLRFVIMFVCVCLALRGMMEFHSGFDEELSKTQLPSAARVAGKGLVKQKEIASEKEGTGGGIGAGLGNGGSAAGAGYQGSNGTAASGPNSGQRAEVEGGGGVSGQQKEEEEGPQRGGGDGGGEGGASIPEAPAQSGDANHATRERKGRRNGQEKDREATGKAQSKDGGSGEAASHHHPQQGSDAKQQGSDAKQQGSDAKPDQQQQLSEWKRAHHGLGVLPSPVPYKPGEALGGQGDLLVTQEVQGPKGSLGDTSGNWTQLRQAARNAVQSGKITLTSAYSEDLSLLINWMVRLEVSKMLLMMDVGRSVLVIAMDLPAYQTLLSMRVPCFYVGDPTVPKQDREAVELRAQWELAMEGMDVIWSDLSTVWMWDVGQTWLRVAHARVDVVSPACGKRQICLGLTFVRSNERTKRYLRQAYLHAAKGGPRGAMNDVFAELQTSWHADMLGIKEEEEGASLVVMQLPKAQFPVIGKDGKWEQLMNGGLVWCLGNNHVKNATELRELMIEDNVYMLDDAWETKVKGSLPSEWFCRALSLDRILEGGRQSPPNQYWRKCANDGLVKQPVGGGAPKKKAPLVKEAENGTIYRTGSLGLVYTYANGVKGADNQVIMQLSQGRAGSTVTGNMMLRSHPFCGMYIDELMWGIYRTRIANRDGSGDFEHVLDVFFNCTQCVLPTKLWGNAKDGSPGTLGSWFGKRDRFGMGVKSRGKDYFKIDHQAKVCAELSKQHPPKAVCVKELKFLGRVGDLLHGAVRRGVRFSILYLLRDPRATTLSQLYSFSVKWFQEMANPMTDVLREQCRIAASDVQAIIDAPKGVDATQICFEDFKDRPKGTLSDVYANFPPFKRWWKDMGGELIPLEVAEFGDEHIANWHPNGSQARKSALKPVQYGQVPVGFDHHYSTDVSRIVHVDSWKDVYIRDKTMQEVWQKDENCIKLRRISKCAAAWPDLDNVPVVDVPVQGTETPKPSPGVV